MTELTIITNNVPRDIVDAWQLPTDARADFDYLDWDAIERGEDTASFFQYRGEWYDLGDIPARHQHVPTDEPDPFQGWDGLASDSFFSGIVVRYANDFESVVVGRYYA